MTTLKEIGLCLRLGLLVLVLAACGLIAAGCGSASSDTRSAQSSGHARAAIEASSETSGAASEQPDDWRAKDKDGDSDVGSPHDDVSNEKIRQYGPAADPEDRPAIAVFIKRYYSTAAAGDGKTACSMIYSTLAESVVEDYAGKFGAPYLRGGSTCSAVLVKLFQHFHEQLAAEAPLVKIVTIRVNSDHRLVVLSFGSLPMRQIIVTREGHSWKAAALLDSEVF